MKYKNKHSIRAEIPSVFRITNKLNQKLKTLMTLVMSLVDEFKPHINKIEISCSHRPRQDSR